MPFNRRSNSNRGPRIRSARPGGGRRGWARGVVVGLDVVGDRIDLRIDEASRGGQALMGREVRIDLAGARLRLPDADGDSRSGLRDVFPGNRVEVRCHARGMDAPVLKAHTLIHLSPDMPIGGLRRLWRT